jgi:hypothetical protein
LRERGLFAGTMTVSGRAGQTLPNMEDMISGRNNVDVSSVSQFAPGWGAQVSSENYSKNPAIRSFQRENIQISDRVTIKSRYLPDQGAVSGRIEESATFGINGKHRQSNTGQADNVLNWNFFLEMRFTSIEQTGVDINNVVSTYLTYKDYIQNNFTGEERDAQMAKLNDMAAVAMEQLARGFSDEMGDFLEKYGLSGEKSILKESVFLWFEEVLKENSGASDKDASLSDFGIAVSSEESAVFYGRDDINALIQLKAATDSPITGMSVTSRRENFPTGFLNYAMQKEAIYDAFSVSDFAKEKMETVFSRRVDEAIDEKNESYDKKLEKLRDRYGYVTDEQLARYAHLDKELIRQVIDSFLENMKSGMTADDAYEKTDYFQNSIAGEQGSRDGNSSPAAGSKYFLPELGRSGKPMSISLPTGKEWIA